MMAVRSQRASRNQVFRISCTQGGIHHENISEICCHRCCCSSFHSKSMRLVVIVNKNEQKLADEIEAAFEKLSKDGTLKKISEKWYHRDLFDQLKN